MNNSHCSREQRRLWTRLSEHQTYSEAALAQFCEQDVATVRDWLHRWQTFGAPLQQSGSEWRLDKTFEALNKSAILTQYAALSDAPLSVTVCPLLDSTNAYLLAQSSTTMPQLCLAEFQTAGRGQQGRSWLSPYGGGLCLSLRLPWTQCPPGSLNLALALSVAEYLRDCCGTARIGLKWPNDLVCEDGQGRLAKLGGLLLETRISARERCVVLGLGLNLRLPPDAALAAAIAQPYTDLAACGAALPGRNALAAQLAFILIRSNQQFQRQGFSEFAPRWEEFDKLSRRAVHLHRPGLADLAGQACGIDAQGGLRVSTADGTAVYYHGEVRVRV